MINQLLQRVWNRSDPANTLQVLSEQQNLTTEPVTDPHVLRLIRRMMVTGAQQFEAAYSARNAATETAFSSHLRHQRYRNTLALWHQSAPDASSLKPGSMPYPLPKGRTSPRKSDEIWFSDQLPVQLHSAWNRNRKHERYLAIYEVQVGHALETSPHDFERLTATDFFLNNADTACNSVCIRPPDGQRGNQFIVYNPAQCTIRYIVRINP